MRMKGASGMHERPNPDEQPEQQAGRQGGRTAIVAGSTGLVGGELLRQLLADPEYGAVVALVRRETALRGGGKLEVRMTDWSPVGLERDLAGKWAGADIYCALGTTMAKAKTREQFRKIDLDYPVLLGQLAARNGASRYAVVSAIGSKPDSLFFYSRVKGEMETALRGLGLRGIYLFQPSLLLGERNENRPAEKLAEVLSKAVAPLMLGSLQSYRPIKASVVAGAMIAAVRREQDGTHTYTYKDMVSLAGGEGAAL